MCIWEINCSKLSLLSLFGKQLQSSLLCQRKRAEVCDLSTARWSEAELLCARWQRHNVFPCKGWTASCVWSKFMPNSYYILLQCLKLYLKSGRCQTCNCCLTVSTDPLCRDTVGPPWLWERPKTRSLGPSLKPGLGRWLKESIWCPGQWGRAAWWLRHRM